MMCPALVAQRARPWFTHGSRCFTFHAGWFDDLPLVAPNQAVPALPALPTGPAIPAVPALPALHTGPAIPAVPALHTGPAIFPSLTCQVCSDRNNPGLTTGPAASSTAYSAATISDIGLLEDVSEADSWEDIDDVSTDVDGDNSASSSTSTACSTTGQRPTNYVPTIKSTRPCTLKSPIPAELEFKRFGFVIEFDRVSDARQTLEWIQKFDIKDIDGRNLRMYPAVVCGSGEGKHPGNHGCVDEDLGMADLRPSEGNTAKKQMAERQKSIARLEAKIRKVENRIRQKTIASLERKVRKQAKQIRRKTIAGLATMIRKQEKTIRKANEKYKRG